MSKIPRNTARGARLGAATRTKAATAKKVVRWNGMTDVKDRRREAILQSVAKVLRNSRLSSLTIQQIADELGMTKGNLYYYFKDKHDILFHCHMRSTEISLLALSDAEALGRTPSEKLRILLVRHIRGIIEDGFGAILQTDLEKIRPAQRKLYISKRDELECGVRDLILEGVRIGEFECANVKLAGFAILGGINWIPKWYQPNGPFSSMQISELMADYYLRGLRASSELTTGQAAGSDDGSIETNSRHPN